MKTMNIARRTLVGLAALGAAFTLCAPLSAMAQKFPDKPLTLYVGFAPGGAADTVARSLADELSKQLGQRVVVENKSGASGNIATQTVLGQPADGHSLIFAAIHFATNPAFGRAPYNPQKDLTMISQITSVPVVMVASNASGLGSPADVVAASKRVAGGTRVGSGGVATSSHLAMELFKRGMDVPMTHVPYRGGAPANQDLMGGQIDMMFDLMSGTLKSMIDAGKIKPIAVMQQGRIAALPDVKSAAEWNLPSSTHIRSWQGVAVKAGTPPAVVNRLHEAVTAAASSEAFRARVAQLGSEVVVSGKPADFQTYYLREMTRWAALVKAANITAD
jgi:tripartite-type tricarboxylate transporter receptor subunit TctC